MQNEMHSFNHPMFGSYDAFFYRFLGGIDVAEDAFACDKIRIAPVFTQLVDHVSASMKTVRGEIVSKWKRENGRISVHIEVPPQTSAEICLGKNIYRVGGGSYDYAV